MFKKISAMILSIVLICSSVGVIAFAKTSEEADTHLQYGVDVKTLSCILGHFSAGFTLDTFAPRKHCRPARLERVAVLCVCSLTRLRSIRHRRRSARSPTSPPVCSRTPRTRWGIF